MSEDSLRSEISKKEDEITKIEEEAAKKEAASEKEVETEYDPQIKETEDKLNTEKGLLDEATEKSAEWIAKKKEKTIVVKNLEREHKTLVKDKAKALSMKLKEIATDKKTKIKAINGEIKALNKEIRALQKAAEKAAKLAAAA